MTRSPSAPDLAQPVNLSGLAAQRVEYTLGALNEEDCAANPLDQFGRWFGEARAGGVAEPNAMTLATVGADGRPSTRIVLLKEADAHGLVWFGNLESRKAREAQAHGMAALQFHWVIQQRQVRIEGRVEAVAEAEADAYYASRPLGSRLGAWASPQSRAISGRTVLEERLAAATAEHGEQPARPRWWGGLRVVPDYWEFWQGRASRLHDRITWRLQADGTWVIGRLAP